MEKLIQKEIVSDPKIMGGVPVIRGTRIPVFVILDYLADGASIEEIIEDFPDLTKETIKEAICFASKMVGGVEE